MNKKPLLTACFSVFSLIGNMIYSQTCLTDQQFIGTDTRERIVSSSEVSGQSFKSSQTGTLNTVSLDLRAVNNVCAITEMDVRIQIIEGNGVTGNQLASQIFTLPVNFTRTLQQFTFTSPASVVLNQMYTIVVDLEIGQSCGSNEPQLVWFYAFPTSFWQATGGLQYFGTATPSFGNTQYFRTCVACSSVAPILQSTQSFCDEAFVSDLTATGTLLTWYADDQATQQLLSSDALTNGSTYYVSNTENNCESNTAPVLVNIIDSPVSPISQSTQSFCDEAFVSDLTATGTLLTWYTDEQATQQLLSSDVLANGTTYYVSNTENGCESNTAPVLVNIIDSPVAPISQSTQSFCDEAFVSDLTATGTLLTWYADEQATQQLLSSDVLTNGTTYYVSNTENGCESETSSTIVSINNSPNNSITQSATTLTALENGANYQWLDCNNGNSIISGATNQTFIATTNGSYAVEITKNGCSSVSDCEIINTINLNEFKTDIIKIYPNPVIDNIIIEGEISKNNFYSIIDQVGRTIKSGKLDENQNTIDLSNLLAGVYTIKVENKVVKFTKI